MLPALCRNASVDDWLKLIIDSSDFLFNPAKFPSCLSDMSASFTPFTTCDSIGFDNEEESQ